MKIQQCLRSGHESPGRMGDRLTSLGGTTLHRFRSWTGGTVDVDGVGVGGGIVEGQS